MNERPDDTTNEGAESRPAREPGTYYYDDATGYETYTPEDDAEETEDEAREPEEQVRMKAEGCGMK